MIGRVRDSLRSISRWWRPAAPSVSVPRTPTAWLCSYPKSGRTWLRFMLSNYWNEVLGLGLDVDLATMFQIMPNDVHDPERGFDAFRFAARHDVPYVVVSHNSFNPKFEDRRIVFLMRSVSDVIVSFYFHNSRQWGRWSATISEFMHSPKFGLPRLVDYMNSWAPRLNAQDTLVVTYESLRHKPDEEMRRIVQFVGLSWDPAAADRAIQLSTVDRMRSLEIQRPLPGHHYDPRDPDARRVRQGRVGGGAEQLAAEELSYLVAYCQQHLTTSALDLYARHQVPLVADRAPRANAA